MWSSSDWLSTFSRQRSIPRLWHDWVVQIDRNLGVQKIGPKKNKNWIFALHLRTASASDRQPQPAKLRHAPDGVFESVGCARQLLNSRRLPETTLEGFSWSRSCESEAQITCKIAKYFIIRAGAIAIWLSPMIKRCSTKTSWSAGGYFEGTRKKCGQEITFPWGVVSY